MSTPLHTHKIDFEAIMSKTNFLTGQYAPGSANAVKTISDNAVRRMIKAHHPAINNAARPKHLVIKPV
jgi:hypothetical protein